MIYSTQIIENSKVCIVSYMKQNIEATISANAEITILNRLRDLLVILLLGGGIFALLSLSTYHPQDSSWTHVGEYAEVHNAAGKIGALIADVALFLFGYIAYLLPLACCYFGIWIAYFKHPLHAISLILLKLTGVVCSFVALCGFFSHFFKQIVSNPEFSGGGIVGYELQNFLQIQFNQTGTNLLLFILLIAGINLWFGFTWLKDLIHVLPKRGEKLKITFSFQFLQHFKSLLKHILPLKDKIVQHHGKFKQPVIEVKTEALSFKNNSEKKSSQGIESKKFKLTNIAKARTQKKPKIIASKFTKCELSTQLLDATHEGKSSKQSEGYLLQLAQTLEQKLLDFGVKIKVMHIAPGPVVTLLEVALAAGIKASKITNLAKDLARSLSVRSVRVVEVIPGKSYVGIEIPNPTREMVLFRELLESEQYVNAESPLSIALGKDISGTPVIADLSKMPHLLIAGTTGSGKSVGINSMLLSMLFKADPQTLKLILIDPKMLELSVYDGIPHLLSPVVTDMKEASQVLRWCVNEMERRYQLMAALGVRNLSGFNQKVTQAAKKGQPILDPVIAKNLTEQEIPTLEPLPYIVVIIDELADLMMVTGKKVEELIARIAQKARAAGIHLILATQRPSVDVITGLIKANVPTRVGFQVSSKIDSRTILDQSGAEQLLGHGDMLYLPPGTGYPLRVHGPFVSDQEVHKVVAALKKQGKPEYIENLCGMGNQLETLAMEADSEQDDLYDQAVSIVLETRRASISSLQRQLRIGYNRAARLIEAMESAGLVSAMQSNGNREVIVPNQDKRR